MTDSVLIDLAATIKQRRSESSENSYTKQLLDAGPARCAKKFGEEAVETVLAGVNEGDAELCGEAADLLYHLLVLLECRNIPVEDVFNVLKKRQGTSGLVEKASRGRA